MENMENDSVTMNAVRTARASFDRCCQAPRFFDAFYANFFAACPAAGPMFAGTDFTRQHRLLQHGIGLLFSLNQELESEPNILTRVAERHGRCGLAVDPAWYPLFLNSLLMTVGEFDPLFTPEIERAWRDATARGIAYMQSKS
jgi:hemoglobin-like flavoprotein